MLKNMKTHSQPNDRARLGTDGAVCAKGPRRVAQLDGAGRRPPRGQADRQSAAVACGCGARLRANHLVSFSSSPSDCYAHTSSSALATAKAKRANRVDTMLMDFCFDVVSITITN